MIAAILLIVGLLIAFLLIGRGFNKGPKAPKWGQDKPDAPQHTPSGEGRGKRLDPLWRKPKQDKSERKHDKREDRPKGPKRGNDGS